MVQGKTDRRAGENSRDSYSECWKNKNMILNIFLLNQQILKTNTQVNRSFLKYGWPLFSK